MLSRIGSSSSATTTVTVPTGHQAGDLILIFAFNEASVTNPTVPSGFTTITNGVDGTNCSMSLGWKVATSTSETSGTWTTATELICIVYRGQLSTGANPFTGQTSNTGATNTLTYGAVTLSRGVGSSWIIAFIAHTSIDTTIETPPTNMTLVVNQLDAAAECAAFDTNGIATGSQGILTPAITGTAAPWISYVIELKAQATSDFNNYQAFKVKNGMSAGERIK